MIWLTLSSDEKFMSNPKHFQEILPSSSVRNACENTNARIIYNLYEGENIGPRDVKETPEEIEVLIRNDGPIINLDHTIQRLIIAILIKETKNV